MPFTQPSRGDVHVNTPLTNISLAYIQAASNFVAGRVFPTISVSKQSDIYFSYDRGEFNRDEMGERLPGTESEGGSYAIAHDQTYYARTYSYHKDVPDQVRANAGGPIMLDREATEYVTLKGLIKREAVFVTNYFTAGDPGDTWTFDVDGDSSRSGSFDPTSAANNNAVYWDDASSTPIEDVRLLKRYVLESTGFMPNTLTLGRPVYDALVDHPDIVGRLDRGQTAGPAMANADALAALFELDYLHVMDAIKNTAVQGQTASHSFIGGKNALLSYRPATPGLMTPAAGYTFNWTGLMGGNNPEGIRIKRFRMENLESDRVEAQMSFDLKKVSADLGAFFGAIVQ